MVHAWFSKCSFLVVSLEGLNSSGCVTCLLSVRPCVPIVVTYNHAHPHCASSACHNTKQQQCAPSCKGVEHPASVHLEAAHHPPHAPGQQHASHWSHLQLSMAIRSMSCQSTYLDVLSVMVDPSAPTIGWPCDRYLRTSCSGRLRVIAAVSSVPTKLREDALRSGLQPQH